MLIPADLEQEKILATGAYGTNIVAINGNYDAVNRLCTEIAGERPWAFVNVNLRPYYAEGSKTLAFETAEQLGWELPDRVVAPIASGSLFTKVARGFQEFIDAGLLERRAAAPSTAPRRSAARRSRPAFAAGTDVCRPVKPDTIAKSLAIGNPADGPYAVELARSDRRRHRQRHRRRDPRRHPPARRDDRHLHRDRRRRDHRRARQARRARRHRPRTSASSPTSPATA